MECAASVSSRSCRIIFSRVVFTGSLPRAGNTLRLATGRSLLHFLQKPAVTIRVIERGKRAVIMSLRMRPKLPARDACVMEYPAYVVEDLTHSDTATHKVSVSFLDVKH